VQRFQFVHVAGLQLNAPFVGVRRTSDAITRSLTDAACGAWDDLVDLCLSKQVAFLAISGGIEDAELRGIRGQLRFRSGLERLSDAGIQTLISLDRCDQRIRDSLTADPISRVTVFPAEAPRTVRVESDGRRVACVAGQSADANDSALHLDQYFADAGDIDATTALVGIVPHDLQTVEGELDQAARKPCYWAVGHADTPSRRGFSPWIVEAGSLQAKAPTGDPAARGAMLIEADGSSVVSARHVELDRIRYASLQIAPGHRIDDALLRHQIMDGLNRLRANHAGRGVIVDIELERDLPESTAQLESVLTELRRETAAWDPFVWCNRLSVHPQGEAPRPTNLLSQGVVEEGRALLSNPLQRSYFFANRFDPLMRAWTDELGSNAPQELVEAATRVALAHTNSEDSAT